MMPVLPHAPLTLKDSAVMSSYLKHHTWLSMHKMHLGIVVHQIYNVKRLKCCHREGTRNSVE